MTCEPAQKHGIVRLTTPLCVEDVEALQVGQKVLLNGTIYTGRDAAHKRLVEAIDRAPRV